MNTSLKTLQIEKELPVSGVAVRNKVLRDLLAEPNVRDYLLPQLRLVTVSPNQVIYELGDKIDLIYFPVDSVFSGLAIMEDGTTVETSMFGREGLVGMSTILGSGLSKQWIWISISGYALQLDTRVLDQVFVQNERALKSLLKCYRGLVTQISQRCVCNTRHTILERLCCWLLMIHDRVDGNNLRLTQEMIASRLGARRAGITVAAGMLQERQAIEYRRGQLHIRSREVLEHAACECYKIMRTQFTPLDLTTQLSQCK
ncbi:MAG TPA: Crp/Fnr family transcriptional regulator [Pyrinomonadaceae bacterium]|nr:Crp/Fnr family transcriptional regulator [Pyrinomonadaceae bacterium]